MSGYIYDDVEHMRTDDVLSTEALHDLFGGNELGCEMPVAADSPIPTCAGVWIAEDNQWRFYQHPEWDE